MNEIQVLYICDRTKCERCYDECKHTTDFKYAKNFSITKTNKFDGSSRVYVVENDEEGTVCEE